MVNEEFVCLHQLAPWREALLCRGFSERFVWYLSVGTEISPNEAAQSQLWAFWWELGLSFLKNFSL